MLRGKPVNPAVSGGSLTFDSPGDDLLCGTAAHYEIRTSSTPIAECNFSDATDLASPPTPVAAGSQVSYPLPAGVQRYVAGRARAEPGNVGPVSPGGTQGAAAAAAPCPSSGGGRPAGAGSGGGTDAG